MKRRFDICRKCRMLEERNADKRRVPRYLCRMVFRKWSLTQLLKMKPVLLRWWECRDVPEGCEFYVEHFVKSCNEEKA